MGPTRSTRLPPALDAWLESRLSIHAHRSASDVLIELIHGGLRLRDGYMSIHRRELERLAGDPAGFDMYRRALYDTFGAEYVAHLDAWLEADGIVTTPTSAR